MPLVADWTDRNTEIADMLETLGSKQIPVLAIFPANRPTDPIVLRGLYTRKQVLEKLAEAEAAGPVAEPSADAKPALASGR